jgi:Cu(I)/Ag(I) efflux system membrane fusion protein/cobalt-zinc-cadmium efflux system membrane fusion protein
MTRREKIFLALIVILMGLVGALSLQKFRYPEDSETTAAAPADAAQYTCGMHPFVIQDEPGTCPICGMNLTPLKSVGGAAKTAQAGGERKIKYWVAPMDPTYIREEPGKSPMGMDLVPVYEDEALGGSVIRIDPVTQQNMGVRTAEAVRRDLKRTVRTVGLVGYEEPRQFSINAKIGGWIETLHVNETGQFIKKGQPLLSIYSPELVAAQEEYLLALNNKSRLEKSPFPEIAEGAERLLESSRKRLNYWDISDRQIERLRKTGEVKKSLTLYAPYDGIVTLKMANEGQRIQAGMELFRISDISNVWIYADIYEYELPWVKVGQEARVELPYGGEPIRGKIDQIYPYLEAKTRTVKARIVLDNPEFTLKPDMYVNVLIDAQTVKDVLAIPSEAVIDTGKSRTVFVALGDGKFEPRQIRTGLRGEKGYIQVEEGLLPGEWVVTSAQFMLDSESQLREAISKMMEPKQPAPSAHEGHEGESLDDLFGEEAGGKGDEKLDDLFR